MQRRSFLAALSVSAAASISSTRAQSRSFELEEATIEQLQQSMRSGQLSAEHMTRLYLGRIEQIDRAGPRLLAVIETNPDAIDIARSLDAERRSTGGRGPLHGIPVLLKDNIDTHDKMQTTAGSLALLNAPTPEDSFIAARLRAAGAVILGKTNLSEWANFRSTHSTSGWSGRGGLTKNPYLLNRNACGSSSGSGVAISANLAAIAIGTETDGSVVCPASMNGIVGIKPTLGLLSRSGIIPIGASQDTAGPMARTVWDAALLLSILAGPDPRDTATTSIPGDAPKDYTQFCDPHGLRGARIGIARQYCSVGPSADRVLNTCIDTLKKAGAVIVDPVEFSHFEHWRKTENTALLYEYKTQLTSYLANRGGAIRSLADCIAFNKAHSAEEMPFFQQELMEQAQEKGPLTDKAYLDALKKNHKYARKQGIDEIVKKHRLDAIAAPTAGPAFVTDLVNGDHIDGGCASPAAVAGYPHITVPGGDVFGLPVGFSFFGTAWSEPVLIRLAYAFEQLQQARRIPRFLPAIENS